MMEKNKAKVQTSRERLFMDRMMPFSSHTVIDRGTSSTHANCFSTSFTVFSAPSHIVIKESSNRSLAKPKPKREKEHVTDVLGERREKKRWTEETH